MLQWCTPIPVILKAKYRYLRGKPPINKIISASLTPVVEMLDRNFCDTFLKALFKKIFKNTFKIGSFA